jgi:hypothetical protein
MNKVKYTIMGLATSFPVLDDIAGLVTNPIGLAFRTAIGAAVAYVVVPLTKGLWNKNR